MGSRSAKSIIVQFGSTHSLIILLNYDSNSESSQMMRLLHPQVRNSSFYFACLMITGCFGGGEQLPDLSSVTGTVTLDGTPLTGANIIFQPQEGGASFALTDDNGNYELLYNANTAGAIPGSHAVKISKEKNPEEPGQNLVPPRYNDQSALTAEVKAGDANQIPFELTTKK